MVSYWGAIGIEDRATTIQITGQSSSSGPS